MSGGDPAVVVDRLVKRYGDRAVVDGVSLEVRSGELVALLGPNGAGKTTTVEIVEGYRVADGGRVSVLGADRQRHPVEDGSLAVALGQTVDDDRGVAGAHCAIRAYWRSKSASVSSPTWIERRTPVRSTK